MKNGESSSGDFLKNRTARRISRNEKKIMKYLPVILIIIFLAIAGCIDSSPYKEVSPSQILSTPDDFEGKKSVLILYMKITAFPASMS